MVQLGRRTSALMERKPRPFDEKRTRAPSRPSSKVLPHTAKAGDPYYIGDVYDISRIRQEYDKLSFKTPYLDYIDRLTDHGWSHLRYLADFMRITTSPPMWRFLSQAETAERASRIKVAMLVIHTHATERYDITDLDHLKHILEIKDKDHHDVIARLFVVEDLSRDLIEAFGSHLDVDPTFFGGHISDYIWYNTRDPWIEIPDLNIVTRQKSHFNIRYAQMRYFRTLRSFKKAREEAATFNVLRRVDRDGNRDSTDDVHSPDIGLVRSKMSFWVRPQKNQTSDPLVGILLVDPPITEGFPLWGGYNSLTPCPSMTDDSYVARPVSRFVFEETVHWIQEMSREEVLSIPRDPRALFLKPLSLVCSEWILLIRYAKTRFSQLEWEVEDPNLRDSEQGLSPTLEKLHTWRRRFPIYKSIITEILDGVIRREEFPGSTGNMLRSLEEDFRMLLSDLDEMHNRADRMMSVVTAVLSIEESQKALEQNRSLGRLTYLAALFIPLSFISSFFSMSEDITKLSKTFWIYFAIAIPVTLLALLVTRYSHSLNVIWKRMIHRAGSRLIEDP
ncbi:MAG: hypothetical protein Q9202_005001 [Teloschistes flavicans]